MPKKSPPEVPKRESSLVLKNEIDDERPSTSAACRAALRQDTDLVISRGVLDPESTRSYEGILYTNTFMVDNPIVLLGVSFFGPHSKYDAETGTYKTTMSLQESEIYRTRRIRTCKILQRLNTTTHTVKKGEKFRVNFPQMIILKPHIWYDIKFELNGPSTGHMTLNNIKTEVILKHEGTDIVKFNFFVGSCQMPDLHFLLP